MSDRPKRSRRAFLADGGDRAGRAAVGRRRLSGDRAVLGARRRGARATASTSARSAPAASRAATTCRASGSTTARAIMAVCDLDSQRVAGRQGAGQRPLRQEDRQAVRRRHRLRATTASCSPTRTSTPSSSARPITGTRSSPSTRSQRRQGRLPAEAGLADHRRRARAEQRRPPVRAASSRSAASSARRRSSATPPSWCATAASAS